MVGDYYAGVYNFVLGQNLGSVCNFLSYLLGKRLADPNFKFKSGKIKRMTTQKKKVKIQDLVLNNNMDIIERHGFLQPTKPADMLGEHKAAPAIKRSSFVTFFRYSLAAFSCKITQGNAAAVSKPG